MASTAPGETPAFPIEWRREVAQVPYAVALAEMDAEVAQVPYAVALAEMDARNAAVHAGDAAELVWLLEHPPVYTAGTSADPAELVDPRFEVVEAGRGGRYTYHGPGQRVGYLVLDLAKRGKSWRAEGRVGIWTRDIDGGEAKIGAIGVRVRRWVTMHGFSVNLDPDLSHFGGIVPCGIAEYGVTSLARLGLQVSAQEWDDALIACGADFLDALDAAAKRACR